MNLTDFFSQEGKREEKSIPFPIQQFQGENIQNASSLNLVFSNQGKGKAGIEGKAELDFLLCCDRCLKEVTEKVVIEFSRTVYAPEAIEDEEMKEDQQFIQEYELDIETLLKEELQLAWPSKVLCSEDCKGICKKCGHNLNEGKCECDDFVPDVRFANLMDIFNGAQ